MRLQLQGSEQADAHFKKKKKKEQADARNRCCLFQALSFCRYAGFLSTMPTCSL